VITLVDAPHLLGYRLLSGLPVRDYTGLVSLTDRGDKTRIGLTAALAQEAERRTVKQQARSQ
jgi:hypothetical protein